MGFTELWKAVQANLFHHIWWQDLLLWVRYCANATILVSSSVRCDMTVVIPRAVAKALKIGCCHCGVRCCGVEKYGLEHCEVGQRKVKVGIRYDDING